MWLTAASSEAQNALVLAIVGALSALLVAVIAGVFQFLSSRQPRRDAVPENQTTLLFERTAVLSDRIDDADERDQVQDRRLDVLERHLDLDNTTWRDFPRP